MRVILEKISSSDQLSPEDTFSIVEYLCSSEPSPVVAGYLFAHLDSLRSRNCNEFYDCVLRLATHLLMRCDNEVLGTGGETMDICGTGGDFAVNGLSTLNISTLATFILSATGVSVVKHGNKAVSSTSGSSDVLSQLGISDKLPASNMSESLRDTGSVFISAQHIYRFLANMGVIRKELGVKTVFNFSGPLTNPLRPKYQMTGVFFSDISRYCSLFKKLGRHSAAVLNSVSGYDEIMPFEPANIAFYVNGGNIETMTLNPRGYRELGLSADTFDPSLEGKSPEYNAQELLRVLRDRDLSSSYAKSGILNAGLAIFIAKQSSLEQSISDARDAFLSGAAFSCLEKSQKFSSNFTQK